MFGDPEDIQVQLLGPFSVRVGDEAVTPSAGKQRQILALLALNARHLVTTDTLVGELWEGRPPRSYSATLQTYIFQVRQELGTAVNGKRDVKQILSTRHSGYLLECRTDVEEVRRLAAAGRSAAEEGNPRAASDVLVRALALWRGPALADVRQGPVLTVEAAMLAETRLSLLQRRIEADLAIHRYADVIGELTSLVAEHPTNENFCRLLMKALYHSGYTARALEMFRQLRASLNRELGVEPGPPLQDLHRSILSGDLVADTDGARDDQREPRAQRRVQRRFTLKSTRILHLHNTLRNTIPSRNVCRKNGHQVVRALARGDEHWLGGELVWLAAEDAFAVCGMSPSQHQAEIADALSRQEAGCA